MTGATSFLIASRFLFGKLGRSRSSDGEASSRRSWRRVRAGVFGVGVSLIPLVLVTQVADGMIEGITRRFLESGTYHIQIMSGTSFDEDERDAMVATALAHPAVSLALRETQGLGLASIGEDSLGVTVRGVEPDWWERDPGLRSVLNVTAGAFSLDEAEDAVVGAQLAASLGLEVGDELKLLTIRRIAGTSFLPRISTFFVRGIVSTGYQDLDGLWFFVNEERARVIMPGADARHIVGIKTADPFATGGQNDVSTIADELRDSLPIGARVRTWYDLERSQYLSFAATKNLLTFIMFMVVVVATVNVSSALVLLVLEKRDELAILTVIGAGPGSLLRLVVVSGALIGAVGAVFGLLVGVFVTVNVNELLQIIEGAVAVVGSVVQSGEGYQVLNTDFYLERIPVELQATTIAAIGAVTVVLSMAASLLPALRAARSRPLEHLRGR